MSHEIKSVFDIESLGLVHFQAFQQLLKHDCHLCTKECFRGTLELQSNQWKGRGANIRPSHPAQVIVELVLEHSSPQNIIGRCPIRYLVRRKDKDQLWTNYKSKESNCHDKAKASFKTTY